MHPVPTELEKSNPRPNPIRRSIPYTVSLLIWIFAGRIADNAIRGHAQTYEWLLPSILAAIAMAYAFWRGERDIMAGQDELQQKIRTEALAYAFPMAIAVMLLIGKFASAGVHLIKPTYYWMPPILPYFAVLYWCKRRYE